MHSSRDDMLLLARLLRAQQIQGHFLKYFRLQLFCVLFLFSPDMNKSQVRSRNCFQILKVKFLPHPPHLAPSLNRHILFIFHLGGKVIFSSYIEFVLIWGISFIPVSSIRFSTWAGCRISPLTSPYLMVIKISFVYHQSEGGIYRFKTGLSAPLPLWIPTFMLSLPFEDSSFSKKFIKFSSKFVCLFINICCLCYCNCCFQGNAYSGY